MWLIFFMGLGLLALLFGLGWAFCVRIRNYGFLDVMWSYGLAILLPYYAWAGKGYYLRTGLFLFTGLIWSVRLGTYILIRVSRHHPQEDIRYQSFRIRWPNAWMFFGFFELQALTVAIFSLPFLLAIFNKSPVITTLELLGLVLSLLAVGGESLADWQMSRFKAQRTNQGKVCQVGLWRYSRHPNYFFEFLVWVGFALAASSSPLGWLSFVCPLLMFYFLFQVTGIPLTEEFALKSKGDAYREYQRTTSSFIPWPPLRR